MRLMTQRPPVIPSSALSRAATASANAASLTARVLASVTADGVAEVLFAPGIYKVAWAPDVAALKAVGITHVILKARSPGVVFTHTNLVEAINWDNSAAASAPISVTAISQQTHNTFDYLHRLSVAASGWANGDWVNIQCRDHPAWAGTTDYVGESFRARTVDASYVWVDGWLEFPAAYVTTVVARKLDDTIKLTIDGIKFAPDGDSTSLAITDRGEAMIKLTAAVGCRIRNCVFDAPWYTVNRFETCCDCQVEDCEFTNGLNQTSNNQLTYGLNTWGGSHNCWMVRCTIDGYRHGFTTGASAATTYVVNDWVQYGEPTNCGARNCYAYNSKGAPFDTHEEGAAISFIDCHADNVHTGDEAGAHIGMAFQVRCHHVTLKGCSATRANNAVNWKIWERGIDAWLKIQDCNFLQSNYVNDSGRGLYLVAGGTVTNIPRLIVDNVTLDNFGTSIEMGEPCKIETRNLNSLRPHRGHIILKAGVSLHAVDTVLDSRSSNLPYALTANRTLYAIQMTGAGAAHMLGLKHILGTDAADGDPPIFDAQDATGTKTISLTDYVETDASGIGPCLPIAAGDHASFTWDQMDETVKLAVANLPSSPMKAGRRVFVTDASGGAQPAWDNGTNWKRYTDGATVS